MSSESTNIERELLQSIQTSLGSTSSRDTINILSSRISPQLLSLDVSIFEALIDSTITQLEHQEYTKNVPFLHKMAEMEKLLRLFAQLEHLAKIQLTVSAEVYNKHFRYLYDYIQGLIKITGPTIVNEFGTEAKRILGTGEHMGDESESGEQGDEIERVDEIGDTFENITQETGADEPLKIGEYVLPEDVTNEIQEEVDGGCECGAPIIAGGCNCAIPTIAGQEIEEVDGGRDEEGSDEENNEGSDEENGEENNAGSDEESAKGSDEESAKESDEEDGGEENDEGSDEDTIMAKPWHGSSNTGIRIKKAPFASHDLRSLFTNQELNMLNM